MDKLYRYFEGLIEPFPETPPDTPPTGLWAFCWHYSRGIWPWLAALGVMSVLIAGIEIDEEEDARIVDYAERTQEAGSLALQASGAISDDGIIDPRDTRNVLGMCLSTVRNREIKGAEGYGVFRL